MSLEEDLKSTAVALVSQQMANWVVDIQRSIAEHQANLVRSLDELQEHVARYDERIDESQIEATIVEPIAKNPAAAGAAAGPGMDALKTSVNRIAQGTSLSEVLTCLVNETSSYVDRAAMFIVRGANAIGWYAKGISQPDAVKQINVPLGADTIFRMVSNSKNPLRGPLSHSPGTAQALAKLGGSPRGIFAVPLMLRDKLAAILYCDSTSEELPQPEADLIESLVLFAGKTIDILSLTPKQARPAATDPPKPAAPSPRPTAAPPAPAHAESGGSSTVMFNASTFAGMKQQAGAASPTLSPEDQKAHEDAKRFARLVVSEIKLYNEAKVNEGRRARDIYERLKEDIERGRLMYSERVPAPIRDSTNYFYDELVRILAGGDATVLGPM